LIILASGWGLLALTIVVARRLFPNVSWDMWPYLLLFPGIPSFFLFLLLEKNLWLSRFIGLKIGPHSSQIGEAIFFFVLGILGLFFRSMAAGQPEISRAKETTPTDTIREVLETVAFVVVLVLLLKTFVAEAFVIPTGSMATTLLGYNKYVTCPECGHKYYVNCSDEFEKQPPYFLESCTCENCRKFIQFSADGGEGKLSPPSPNSGDRVLVAKFLNDLCGMPRQTFDVVVFKYPEGPTKNHVPTNFIKRLIGLPEQTIGIYYGDLYVASKKDLMELGVSFEGDEDKPLRQRMLKNRAKELLESGHPCFRILRKPPDKILALERLVYDNDHQAVDLIDKGFPAHWAAESDGKTDAPAAEPDYKEKRESAGNDAWAVVGSAKGPQGFRCGKRQDDRTWLRYRHLVADRLKLTTEPKPQLITDFMSYNSGGYRRPDGSFQDPPSTHRWVGDLILEMEVEIENPVGQLILELCKGPDRFRAQWDLSSGMCSFWRNKEKDPLEKKQTDLKHAGTYLLRFANVDRRLTVWVDRSLPFGDGFPYDPPRDGKGKIVHQPMYNDLQPASIGARAGASLTVRKLKLFRDTYYLSEDAEHLRKEVIEDPGQWEENERKDAPDGLTMYVQPGHYLCLGDNSPSSSDGRSWGLVPEHMMLGRALAIYYPFYRFGRIE
jgi:signal peptidase I